MKHVWYKVANEDISTARSIYKNNDAEIKKVCEETNGFGETDLYIVYGQNADEIRVMIKRRVMMKLEKKLVKLRLEKSRKKL